MNRRPRAVVVGSGTMGTAVALTLARRGVDVWVFEKGPDYPYPHTRPFEDSVLHDWQDPAQVPPADIAALECSGSTAHDLASESVIRLGGAGTAWAALATRMTPVDFRTGSRYGLAEDWPIDYDALEPWMCDAEDYLGVSGTDADNPWAPPRSRPYPLPPFELAPDDHVLAERLAADGIRLHSTPQARTRLAYDRRPACMNVGECQVCPNGARYSPTHHLQRAIATGRCRVTTDASVRRVLADHRGRACGVRVRLAGEAQDREVSADVVVVAGAAFESARLLLLSRDTRHPDGLGNGSGHVGRHLSFHHIWTGHLHYRERLFPGRFGWWTAQCDQFVDPPDRGRVGGVKIELPSRAWSGHQRQAGAARSLDEAMRAFEVAVRCRQIGMHAESDPTDGKHVTLSTRLDRWGDPLAHVHYDSSELDHRTHAFARSLTERVARATGAVEWEFPGVEAFGAFNHYMGTCRMSRDPADGVVDAFGEAHDTPGLHVVGLPTFVTSGGAVNPTLTGVALALRTAERVADALLRT